MVKRQQDRKINVHLSIENHYNTYSCYEIIFSHLKWRVGEKKYHQQFIKGSKMKSPSRNERSPWEFALKTFIMQCRLPQC